MWLARCLALTLVIGCGGPDPLADGGVDAGAVHAAGPDAGRDAGPADASAMDGGSDAAAPPGLVGEVLAELDTGDAAAVDSLLHRLAWTHRLPLSDGSRWLFVTRWDDAPASVSLVSDVNGWRAGAHPATRAASGAHYYVVIDESELEAPARGAKYKWHGAPDVYRAPPESTAYGYDAFGGFGWVAPPVDAAYLERFPDLRSAHLDVPRTLRAYLPAGFEAGSTAASRARVLLLHDGQNVFHPDAPHGGWRVDAALSADAAYADVVALAIDNAADRMSAYTHAPDRIGGSLTGGRADDYLRLVEEEALPFFRMRYGVAAEGDALVVGGSSLGGLVSLYAALVRPGLAGCVIAMSPTLGWGAFEAGRMDALIHRWTAHGPVAVYLDSGGGGTCADADGDGVQEDGDDSDNFCTTSQLRDHLDAHGYDFDVDLWHWHEPGARHDEAAWAARVPRALAACAASGWR